MNTHWYRTIVDSPAGRRVVQLLILALISVGLGIPPTAAWAVGRERAVVSAPLPPGKVKADARAVDPPPTQERAPDDSPLARERAAIEAEAVDAPNCDASPDGTGGVLPQGVTADKFAEAAEQLRAHPRGQEGDLVVQGSRAAGTARPDSDIDFAIRVSPERLDQLIGDCFGTPNPGSQGEDQEPGGRVGEDPGGRGRDAGLRKLLARTPGMKVDLSVIRIGGAFDNPPFIGVP
ncbi:nucleotidyltransferase domain-containing protein [Kitasatospora purpeofusca]|uniref:nucleotidyltransferase domain-containing protein n=1 Tax=Kitasatospora purpeofusca TaxID=67352 RepID=UPI0037FF2DB6